MKCRGEFSLLPLPVTNMPQDSCKIYTLTNTHIKRRVRIDTFPEDLVVLTVNIIAAYDIEDLPFDERQVLYDEPEYDETKVSLYLVCERATKPARVVIKSDFPIHVVLCDPPHPFQIVVDGPILLDRENKIESNLMLQRRTHF